MPHLKRVRFALRKACFAAYRLQFMSKVWCGMRVPLIAANWKMNKTIPEAVVLAQDICNNLDRFDTSDFELVVFAPALDIKPVKTVFEFEKMPIELGAQNFYYEQSGAFTGEISPAMIQSAGCSWALVGHSERRELFGETNDIVHRKVLAALEHQLNVMLCVGESAYVRDSHEELSFVQQQLKAAFAQVDASCACRCAVAYEPLWAIGTGVSAPPESAERMGAHIRSVLLDIFGMKDGEQPRILYGGSVTPGSVANLMNKPHIDGVLVGKASLEARSFVPLVQAAVPEAVR